MTPDRLINMLLRQLINRLLRKGVNGGIDLAAARGKPREDMTQAERQQARAARQTAKRARQALRASRKIGRF
jgi:hypothetical protein